MAISLLTYGGLITKIRSMESDLITADDYTKISYMDSIQEFTTYLKQQSAYIKIFENYDENTLHRSQIEQLMRNGVHLAYSKIYLFANQEQRNILSILFFRYEVNILKLCLQKIFTQENDYNLLLFESFFTKHSDLHVDLLSSSKTIEEFILHLKDSTYYHLLQKLYNTHHSTLHDYESQLDIYYFTKVWTMIKHLPNGTNKKIVQQIYGTQIDILNILWIYRSKKYYDTDSATILISLIPIHYKLTKKNITKLIEAVSTDDFLKLLSTTYYHYLVDEFNHTAIEAIYDQQLQQLYKQLSTKHTHSMAPVLRYLYEKEKELDKLTTALECIRYRLDPNEIQRYLL